MALREVRLTGTTDGSGDATITSNEVCVGWLYAVEWIDGDLADGVDAVLSTVATRTPSGVSHTLLTLTNANNDAWYFPREIVQDNTGTNVTYEGTNEVYAAQAMLSGQLQRVSSSGGATATGGCIVYYEDN